MARPVDVRRAGPDELESLVHLWEQARTEALAGGRPGLVPSPQVVERLTAALASDELYLLVARWDGRPAGYAVLRPAALTPWLESPSVHLEYLYVAPDLRHHGVARALLLAVTAMAERQGIEQVISHVAPTAREMHRFYARLGFSPLVVRRATQTGALRRRLSGESGRHTLEDLLSRRRSMRARGRFAPVSDLPVVEDAARLA